MIYKLWWIFITQIYRLFIKKIGIFSYIAPIQFLYGGKSIFIGNKVRIFPNLRIECHDKGKIIIGDDVGIAQNVHITCSKYTLSIGNHVTILANTFITNIDHDYRNLHESILKQKNICKETRIGDYCFIGYGASIQAGTILGKQCVVGTNSVVRGIFPDYSVIVGAPGKIIKRYNVEKGLWLPTNEKGDFLL